MRFCRLRWVGRGIGVGLFSTWVFDRVTQDHRWGGVVWGTVCCRGRLLFFNLRRNVSERGAGGATAPADSSSSAPFV